MHNSWRFYSIQLCYFCLYLIKRNLQNVTSVGKKEKLKESRLRMQGWSSRRLERKKEKNLASAHPQSLPSSLMSIHIFPNFPMRKWCLSKEWKVALYYTIPFIFYLIWNKLPTFLRYAVTVKPSVLDHDPF